MKDYQKMCETSASEINDCKHLGQLAMPLLVRRSQVPVFDDLVECHGRLVHEAHHETWQIHDLPSHFDPIVLEEELLILSPLAEVSQDAAQETSCRTSSVKPRATVTYTYRSCALRIHCTRTQRLERGPIVAENYVSTKNQRLNSV